ncbi:MAG: nitroreductase family protein [Terriglobia bacterium]|jgi:nitroreductase
MEVMDLIESKAVSESPVHDLIARRWSPREFSSRPVEPEKLASLFEAARWAPSSYNQQPWNFVVARRENPADFERLLGLLAEQNATWARSAPVLAISVAQRNFTHNGQPNRFAFHDVGQAVAYLTLQATALGLSVHQMGGFDVERARELLAIPAGYEPVAAIALGYAQYPAVPPPSARTRRAASEFVFSGEWGKHDRSGE